MGDRLVVITINKRGTRRKSEPLTISSPMVSTLIVVVVPVHTALVPFRALSRIRRGNIGLPSLQRSNLPSTPQKSQHPSKQTQMAEIRVHLPNNSILPPTPPT
jgi:hypothetical protein